jgi:hypothetical protein
MSYQHGVRRLTGPAGLVALGPDQLKISSWEFFGRYDTRHALTAFSGSFRCRTNGHYLDVTEPVELCLTTWDQNEILVKAILRKQSPDGQAWHF